MYSLVVEDHFISRKVLHTFLRPYGESDTASDGEEALEAYHLAIKEGKPYDLLCLDIMMPNMDGRALLEAIRKDERDRGIAGFDRVKIIMTTALDDSENILGAFRDGCEGYLVKPLDRAKLEALLKELKLI